MKFKDYLTEEFSNKTLKELELLLQHHHEDLEEYKDSDMTAYEATKKDIQAIKMAIKKLQTKSEGSKTPGNQDLGSADSMGTAVAEMVTKSLKKDIDIKYDEMADGFEDFLELMTKADKGFAKKMHKHFDMLTSAYDDYLTTRD